MSEIAVPAQDRPPTPLADAMMASIGRYVAGKAIDSLPNLAPAVLEAGNQRAEAAYGADNVHKLLIVGPDAVIVENQEATPLQYRHVGDFLGALVAIRTMVKLPTDRDRTFFKDAPSPLVRKKWAVGATDWSLDNLILNDGYSLLARNPRTKEVGLPDVIVKDIRHTGLYRQKLADYQFRVTSRAARERLGELQQAAVGHLRPHPDANTPASQPVTVKAAGNQYSTGGWQDRAACRDPAISKFFFPPTNHSERRSDRLKRVEVARGVCQSCQFKDRCLEDALARQEAGGVWGGVDFSDDRERCRALGKRRYRGRPL